MKPLVSASIPNRRFIRSAWCRMALALTFVVFLAVLYVTGEPWIIVGVLAFQALFVVAALNWIKFVRLAQGSRPVLEGRVHDGVITLRTRVRHGGFGERGMPKLMVLPDVRDLWLSEQNADDSMEILFGLLPHRYWLVGDGLKHAFGSYSRLSREDLKPLAVALDEAGISLHVVLERTATEGPIIADPVGPGAPRTVTLGLPDGFATIGTYSQPAKPGWIPAHQAYASGFVLPATGHLPVTMTFSVDRLDSTGWVQLPGVRLPAYADTLAISTRSGIAQALVQVPQGFSIAYVFRRVGPSGSQIYIHLDGPPATPV